MSIYGTALSQDFWELFQGREDIFGNANDPTKPIRGGHGVDRTAEHLHADGPIGVYPMVGARLHVSDGSHQDSWAVRWGCVDFDEGYEKSWPDALNVKNLLAEFGITAWIEKTRSKGWHVWVFASDWVPARIMRRALLAACQIVGAPTKEINPKQETLEPGQVGNFVRLPYPGGAAGSEGRQAMHEQWAQYSASDFVREALNLRCTAAQLERLVDLYKEPPKPRFTPSLQWEIDTTQWPALVREILEAEPFERKRSDQMVRIARLMADAGFPATEARAAVEAADNRWGKYLNRKDRDQRLDEIVAYAY